MPPRKTSVSTKPKQSPIRVSARIASRTIKHTEPLNLFTSTIATDSAQNEVTPESPLFDHDSKPLATMGSSEAWDDKSVESKIEDFQQNPELVSIMEKILEKHKEHYILALAQQGAKLPSDFDVTNLKRDEEESPLDLVTQKLQELQLEMERMKKGQIQPAEFSLEKVCPLPFDKNITFTPFPPNVQIPKYDKYFGTSDP